MGKVNFLFCCLLCVLFFSSCSKRSLSYFSDLERKGVEENRIENSKDLIIQPDDLLSISVTSLSPEANILFNKGEIVPVGHSASYPGNSGSSPLFQDGYLVDKDGYIDFPILGKVQLAGLSKEEAKAAVNARLEQYLKEPMVSIRFLNFKITVIGEVNRPATFTVPTEKITILEAISMAGDLTNFGKRDNVLLLREEQGVRKMITLNLNKKDLLNSPYFYLQQNDLVYVEPVRARAAQASNTRNNLGLILSASSVISIILTRLL